MTTSLDPIKSILESLTKPEDKFPKIDIFKLFIEHFTEHSRQFTIEDRLTYLLSQLEINEKELYTYNNAISEETASINRRAIELSIDSLRTLIEKHMDEYTYVTDKKIDEWNTYDNYKYYPDIRDPNFNKYLSQKSEFINTSLPLIVNNQITSKDFKLSNAQRFAKNFISDNTPYNGVLLWHEVGVGKTCAGISIAENFRNKMNANNKKILILTPSETLQQNWTDEIFNVEKELNKRTSGETNNIQCTGTTYSDKFSNLNQDNYTSIKRQVKKYISQFYEVTSYNQLASSVRKKINRQSVFKINKEKALINYIKSEFSNRLIIMDEIHTTRQADESDRDKQSVEYIELIARYAENTKIVLLTATPMYNISSEIIWLLNILLLNDKRAPLLESDIFTKDGIKFKDDDDVSYTEALNTLVNKSRGYISYVRGSNPLNFPLRIEPTKATYTPNPTREIINGEPIDIDVGVTPLIKNMKLFKHNISEWQWKYLRTHLITEEGSTTAARGQGFSQKPIMGSNIIFPDMASHSKTKPTDTNGLIGSDGFDGCFTYNKSNGTYTINQFARKIRDTNPNSFIHTSNLGQFSRKLNNILKSCITNKGIGFIFSQYLKSGVTIMALILEQNGFVRYVGNNKDKILLSPPVSLENRFCAKHMKYYKNLTVKERSNFVQARYILLDGALRKPELNQLIKECRGEGEHPNLEGEHIKIILGSKVVEQGLSLLRVREVHIMDPWHHLNQMEQATGRAVRNKSHLQLPEDKRNVTVYLHSSALPLNSGTDVGIETPDERAYRRGYNKKFNMAKVERVLKRNAIDCDFNKKGNVYIKKNYVDVPDDINPLKERTISDSKGDKRTIDMYDNDNDARCEFEECDYNCFSNIDTSAKIKDNDTNSLKFSEYDIQFTEEYILTLFKEAFAYYEITIIEEVIEQLNTENDKEFNDEIIYTALNNIVEKKLATEDIYGRRGYIINIGEIYIFQPFELENTDIPMLYRYIPNFVTTNKTTLENIAEKKIVMRKKQQKKAKETETTMTSIDNTIIKKWTDKLPKTKFNNKVFTVEYEDKGKSTEKGGLLKKLLSISDDEITKVRAISTFDNPLNFSSDEKISLLKHIVRYNIIKDREYHHHHFKDLFQIYDKCGFIIRKEEIVTGFKFVTFRTVKKQLIISTTAYIYNTKNNTFEEKKDSLYDFDKKKMNPSKTNLYGWIGFIKPDSFYIKDNTKENATRSKGVVCGTATIQNKGKQIIPLIKSIIEESNSYKKKHKQSKTVELNNIETIIKKANYGVKNLCSELELILRYLDSVNKTTENKRLFYLYEERLLHENKK